MLAKLNPQYANHYIGFAGADDGKVLGLRQDLDDLILNMGVPDPFILKMFDYVPTKEEIIQSRIPDFIAQNPPIAIPITTEEEQQQPKELEPNVEAITETIDETKPDTEQQ